MIQDVHFKTFCPFSNSSSNVSQTNNANSRASYLMTRRNKLSNALEKNKLKRTERINLLHQCQLTKLGRKLAKLYFYCSGWHTGKIAESIKLFKEIFLGDIVIIGVWCKLLRRLVWHVTQPFETDVFP